MKRFVELSAVCVALMMFLMCSNAAFAAIGAESNSQMTGQAVDPNMMATTGQPMMNVPTDMDAFSMMNAEMNADSRAIMPQYIDPAMKPAQMMPYSSDQIQTMPMQPSYMPNTAPNYMMPVPNAGVPTMPGMDSNMYAPYGVQPQFQPSPQYQAPQYQAPQYQAPQYGSADQSYNQAMQAYRMRDYQTAMSKFQEVAMMYPQSDLADNAYYWMGEIYYASRNYAEAIRSFQTVMQMYPAGNKLPDAMVKMGFAYAEMQQYDVARTILNDVTMRFSNNARIRDLAAKKLQQLPMMMY